MTDALTDHVAEGDRPDDPAGAAPSVAPPAPDHPAPDGTDPDRPDADGPERLGDPRDPGTDPGDDAVEADAGDDAGTGGGSAGGSGGGGIGPRIGRVFLRAWDRFASMPVEGYVTLAIVGVCVVFVVAQLHPWNLISDTTPAGGDMGAHVWGPAYLRDHLLPKGRLIGWTPDWYAGFPAYQYYMIVPSLAIALLSYVIPYGVAFKLVAVSGCVTLPLAAWFFGRMARLPFPTPALLAVAATVYLFDRSFSIYGGNIASTLAGEFCFSISLSFGLAYLGVLARGLENGKHRGWAALLLALCGLCHLIPFLFVIVATLVWLLLRPGKGQLWYLLTMGTVGCALVAFWILPFYGKSGYMTDMGWEKIVDYSNYLWSRTYLDPQLSDYPNLRWVIAFAAVGLLLSLVNRRRAGVFWAGAVAFSAAGFRWMPQARLWNARILPFYYLSLYLLAAIGIAELIRLVSALFAPDVNHPIRSVQIAFGAGVSLVIVTILGLSCQFFPFAHTLPDGTYGYQLAGREISTTDKSFIPSWADWNFQGYEGYTTTDGVTTYQKSYPEYYGVVSTMKRLGQQQGCGRAMWEQESQHDRFGTPMALMLLPFWTDSCIGSMEGLYFEASATTPYHFLDQDELSENPSDAEREMPYVSHPLTQADLDLGVSHLQMMGVKYYMVVNGNTKQLADNNKALTKAATTGPWTIYTVADAPLVQALTNQPAVLTGQATTGPQWQDTSVCWYVNRDDWDVTLTADGPSDWQRVSRTVQPPAGDSPQEKCEGRNWTWFDVAGGPKTTPLPPVAVSNVQTSDDSVSFDVDKVGVPVLVKVSDYPNWKASGADGPYRSTPNFMVVVPTSNHVELHYGYTGIDIGSDLITLLGIVGLVLLFRARPVTMAPPGRFWGRAERPDLYPSKRELRALERERQLRESEDAWLAVVGAPVDGAPPGWPPGSPPGAVPGMPLGPPGGAAPGWAPGGPTPSPSAPSGPPEGATSPLDELRTDAPEPAPSEPPDARASMERRDAGGDGASPPDERTPAEPTEDGA
jgi:hypothetical protein